MSLPHAPAAIAAAVFLACTPAAVVRPGDGAAPTLWRIRSDASQVMLLGTMTQWRPQPLQGRDGIFELNLSLSPGRYEYRLEARDQSGIHPIFPEGVERTDDGFGGENLVLRVP